MSFSRHADLGDQLRHRRRRRVSVGAFSAAPPMSHLWNDDSENENEGIKHKQTRMVYDDPEEYPTPKVRLKFIFIPMWTDVHISYI